MGALCKVLDAILLRMLVLISVAAPLRDSQSVLHESIYPELLWPLALLNVYGMLASKPWLNTTCRIFGASLVTSMAAILGELLGSPKASDKLLIVYSPFTGFGILAMLRGLVPHSGKAAPTTGKGPALARKKRA
ncbi:Transmembrane protein 97, putative [Theobroma cacao]|uniref:Transmembrane protein 97, putative n=1 Tax=Theobroma cacao TaxID=3641 RepID=A0A061EGL6_THECC|nr:Transmembrane protein 97, putative [Theobroma cacao]